MTMILKKSPVAEAVLNAWIDGLPPGSACQRFRPAASPRTRTARSFLWGAATVRHEMELIKVTTIKAEVLGGSVLNGNRVPVHVWGKQPENCQPVPSGDDR
jgi:hypothetical protein